MEAYAITASKLLELVRGDRLAAQTARAVAKSEGIDLRITLEDDLAGWLVCIDKFCRKNKICERERKAYRLIFTESWRSLADF